jgi:catechol 2,3-dioxygenase-like lactoylglutathione lyase family enzyme
MKTTNLNLTISTIDTFSLKKIIQVLLVILMLLYANTIQSQELKCPSIKGIAHIGYYSTNYSADSVFYGQLLGLKAQKPRVNKDGIVDMLKFNVNSIQTIELFREKSIDSTHFYHFAILVDNSENMRQYLLSKGIEVPETPVVNFKNYFSKDYNNQICEIVDYRRYPTLFSDTISDLKIKKVGFIVPDLEKSLDFYCNILNLVCVEKEQTSKGWFAKLNIPNTEQYIELVQLNKAPKKSEEGYYNYYCLENGPLKTLETNLNNLEISYKWDELKKESITLYDFNDTRVVILK